MGQYKENFSSAGYVSLDSILYISVRYSLSLILVKSNTEKVKIASKRCYYIPLECLLQLKDLHKYLRQKNCIAFEGHCRWISRRIYKETLFLCVFLVVNWLRWAWLWLATRRRFYPLSRVCRPRGHTSKYNSVHINTMRQSQNGCSCDEFHTPWNGVAMDTLCLGLHWFWDTPRWRQHGRLTPSPSRSFHHSSHPRWALPALALKSPSNTATITEQLRDTTTCRASQIISHHKSSRKVTKIRFLTKEMTKTN